MPDFARPVMFKTYNYYVEVSGVNDQDVISFF